MSLLLALASLDLGGTVLVTLSFCPMGGSVARLGAGYVD